VTPDALLPDARMHNHAFFGLTMRTFKKESVFYEPKIYRFSHWFTIAVLQGFFKKCT
jgi:hypothetical protein